MGQFCRESDVYMLLAKNDEKFAFGACHAVYPALHCDHF